MRVRVMFYRPNDKFRGWFDETQIPRRLSPRKQPRRKSKYRRPSLKKLSPAVESLLFGNLRTVTEDKIAA